MLYIDITFLWGEVVWFYFGFCPRQIRSLSSVSSVENDKYLINLEIYGPQFENLIEVLMFFLHSTFSLKETPCAYIALPVRVSNKHSSLCLSVSALLHVLAGWVSRSSAVLLCAGSMLGSRG